MPGCSQSGPFQSLRLFCLRRAHFWPPKNGRKNRWGDPRLPLFVQWDACKGTTWLPLNFCGASGLLVIGAVVDRPCLTALGMMDVSVYATIDKSTPLTERQPKLDKQPAADQMSGGISDSVAAQYQV